MSSLTLAWAFLFLLLLGFACTVTAAFLAPHWSSRLGWFGVALYILAMILLSGARHALFY